MKTKIHFFLSALALTVPAGLLLWAEENPAAASKGQVLLLDNERTLEGEVERIGEQYRVRRTVGETWVPAGKVRLMCRTHEEAYHYLRSRANLRDPDERLRLAQWCHLHDLREQALVEVKAAAELRPEHAATQRLLAGLQRAAALPPAPRPAQPAEKPETPPPATPPVDVTQEVLGQFVTRVQPILLNACASCHASDRGGSFKLARPYDSEVTGRRTLQQNLTAVLAQVNLEQPQASPLLTRAVSVHGEMKDAPLRGRQAVAYVTLEDWVKRTVADNPHLRAASHGTPAVPAKAGPEPEPSRPAAAPSEASAPPVQQTPEPPAQAVDPFDPAIFNRQTHPDKK